MLSVSSYILSSSLESSLAHWVALSNKIKLYVYKQINLIYLVLSLIISFFSVAPLVASHTSQLISGWGGAGTSEQHRKTAARLHFTTECSLFQWYLHICQLPLPFLWMTNQPFWVTHLKLMVRLTRIQSKRSVVILAWKRAAEPITKFGNKWEKHGLLDGD